MKTTIKLCLSKAKLHDTKVKVAPKDPCHDKSQGGENVTHCDCECCGCVLHSSVVKYLVQNRPGVKKLVRNNTLNTF